VNWCHPDLWGGWAGWLPRGRTWAGYLAGFDGLQVDVGVARGRIDAVLADVLVGVVRGGLREVLVDALPGRKGQGRAQCHHPRPVQKQDGDAHLSASTSSGGVPAAHRRTIHAASKAARKPLATPVPSGQKGCGGKGNEGRSWSRTAGRGGWEEAGSCRAWPGMKAGSSGGTRRERTGGCLLPGR